MKTKALLVIPIINENPTIFNDLIKSVRTFMEFDLLFSISFSNNYLDKYNLLQQENKDFLNIHIDPNNNKSVLFKSSIEVFKSNRKFASYKHIITIKNFTSDHISLLYKSVTEINKTYCKIIYFPINKLRKKDYSYPNSEIAIIEKDFLLSLNINPLNRFKTYLKLLLKVPKLKREALILSN